MTATENLNGSQFPHAVTQAQSDAVNAFQQVSAAMWLAHHRGEISADEFHAGMAKAHDTYARVMSGEGGPERPHAQHGEALRSELVSQAKRMVR